MTDGKKKKKKKSVKLQLRVILEVYKVTSLAKANVPQ